MPCQVLILKAVHVALPAFKETDTGAQKYSLVYSILATRLIDM